MPPRTKRNDSDRYAKVKKIEEMIAKGWSKKSLRIFIDEKFGLRSHSAQNKLIGEALDSLNEGDSAENIRRLNEARLDQIFEREFSKDNPKYALEAVKEINKMHGIYSEKKDTAVNVNVYNIDF